MNELNHSSSSPVPSADTSTESQNWLLYSEADVHTFIGWLSADIPELHAVEVPSLKDSWDRFKTLALARLRGEAAVRVEE